MPKFPRRNSLNNMRGFNKTPGQLGDYIYNSTHKPINFRNKNQELKNYYNQNVTDHSKQIREMKKFKGFNNKLGG